MTEHDDQDDLNKGGELMGDHTLIAEIAESGADIHREDGNNHALHDLQYDILELLQQAAGNLAFGPDCGKADQQGEGQGTHDGHDLRDVELEDNRRKITKTFHIGHDGKVRDEPVTGCGAHESRADGTEIGNHNSDTQHAGSVVAHPGDGRGNKTDDDQRNAEHDELTENILQGDDNLHRNLAEDLTEQDADDQGNQQAEGETGKDFFHKVSSDLIKKTSGEISTDAF